MTLIDALPQEFSLEYRDSRAWHYRDVEVETVYSLSDETTWKPWPGAHRNVMKWVKLVNGIAVGWNENPNRGWSFPIHSLR